MRTFFGILSLVMMVAIVIFGAAMFFHKERVLGSMVFIMGIVVFLYELSVITS